MIPTSIIETAIQATKLSSITYRHAAIVYDDHGRILGIGWNDPHSNDIAKIFYPLGKWHAEALAIMRSHLNKKDLNKKLYMLVIRVNKRGVLRMSKPCIHCQKFIAKYPFKQIYYSCDEGFETLY